MRKKREFLTTEHKQKIANSLRGKKKNFSPEAIENIRKAAFLRRGVKTTPCSQEKKEKIREATTGKKKIIVKPNPGWFSKGHKSAYGFQKGHPSIKGLKRSEETKKKISEKLMGHKGIKYPDGRPHAKGRGCVKTYKWKHEVKQRAGNKCERCYSEKDLHAHHIVRWKDNKELRWDLSNGMCLCRTCHGKEEGFQKGHVYHPKKELI